MSPGQQSINEGLQRMKNALEKGEGVSSQEYAQMAAKQAALRNALRKKQAERQQQGNGTDQKLQELIDEMDRSEEDLVNKRLTNEMMQRQQEIMSKLLEHEKAERQQDQDERRKSDTARQRERELPPSLQEYLKKREAEIDMFKTVSPSLKPYYKYLVDEYFKSLRAN
jgi:chromosome segregation ATPase